jgi:hypothetical protein
LWRRTSSGSVSRLLAVAGAYSSQREKILSCSPLALAEQQGAQLEPTE